MSNREFSTWIADAAATGLNPRDYDFLSSLDTNRNSGVAILHLPDFYLVFQISIWLVFSKTNTVGLFVSNLRCRLLAVAL